MNTVGLPEYITREQLLAIINAGLTEHEDCAHCTFTGPLWHLQEPESDGCNWSDDIVLSGGPECDYRACGPIVGRLLQKLRTKYGLRSDDGWLDDLVFTANGRRFVALSRSRPSDLVAWWYVSIDGGDERKAFHAEPTDTDPTELRSRVLAWSEQSP